MIKVPSYLDFISKLANYLGVDFDENTNKTGKCRIKELREFNQQVDVFKEHYLPKFYDVLGGDDLDKKQAIQTFFIMVESLLRFLGSKNYYTLANEKRGMWALLVFYFIPKMASMISMYKKDYDIPQHLVNNGFMLPIMQSNQLVTPTSLLKEYLNEIVRSTLEHDKLGLDFGNYIADLKNNITPRHQTKFRIIKESRKTIVNPEKIQEIKSIINCAIFSSSVYQELCSYFKDETHAYMLIEYFRKCLDICDKGLIDATTTDSQLSDEFKQFVLSHLDYTFHEFHCIKAESNIESYGIQRHTKLKEKTNGYRNYFFCAFNSYLYETRSSEVDTLEDIDASDLCKGILRYKPDHMVISSDKERVDIVNLLNKLKCTFDKPKNGLNEKEIVNILEEIKCNKYFKNYEHEFLYYNGLHYLAKNDFLNAKQQLKLVQRKCKEITAGETNVSASNLLIILRLLSENTISYSHLNSEIQAIIDSQPEEVNSRYIPNLQDPISPRLEEMFSKLQPNFQTRIDPQLEKFILKHLPNSQTAVDQKTEDFVLKLLQKSSEDQTHKKVYLDKTIKLIEQFNANGYCCYNGFACEKYNPLKKLEAFLSDFFERYDDEKYFSEIEELKIQKIIKALVKGSNAKYNLKRPIVAIFQFTIIEAFQPFNRAVICVFYYQAKLSSKSIDRLFSSEAISGLLTQTIENL